MFVQNTIPKATRKNFHYLQEFILVLLKTKEYNIGLKPGDIRHEGSLHKVEKFFWNEQIKIQNSKNKNSNVVNLIQNFTQTAIYNDKHGKRLRNGNNPMIAMFLSLFAQECYPRFNHCIQNHFKN